MTAHDKHLSDKFREQLGKFVFSGRLEPDSIENPMWARQNAKDPIFNVAIRGDPRGGFPISVKMDTGANLIVITKDAASRANLQWRQVNDRIVGFGGVTTSLGYIEKAHVRAIPCWLNPNTDAVETSFITWKFENIYVTDFDAGVDMLIGRQALEEASPVIYDMMLGKMGNSPCEFLTVGNPYRDDIDDEDMDAQLELVEARMRKTKTYSFLKAKGAQPCVFSGSLSHGEASKESEFVLHDHEIIDPLEEAHPMDDIYDLADRQKQLELLDKAIEDYKKSGKSRAVAVLQRNAEIFKGLSKEVYAKAPPIKAEMREDFDRSKMPQADYRPHYKKGSRQADLLKIEMDLAVQSGWIRKATPGPHLATSPFSVIVESLPGESLKGRGVLDLRKINFWSKKVHKSMPHIPEILRGVRGKKIFAKIDLRKAFFQMLLDDESCDLFGFYVEGYGYYQYVRMPMGWVNSSFIFQAFVEKVLEEFRREGWCFVYVDDILIASYNDEEHEIHLNKVLEALYKNGLRASISKCVIFAEKLPVMLGFELSGSTISITEEALQGIRDLPVKFASVSDLRAFKGALSTYHEFVPGFHIIAAPIAKLTGKGTVLREHWNSDLEKLCVHLKELVIANRHRYQLQEDGAPLQLTTDGSAVGLGAILSQMQGDKEVPLSSISKWAPMGSRDAGMQELRAAVWAFHKLAWIIHCSPHPVNWRTDHKNLALDHFNAIKSRMWLQLHPFQFTIQHVPGLSIPGADGLSRLFTESINDIAKKGEVDRANLVVERIVVKRPPHLVAFHGYIQGIAGQVDSFDWEVMEQLAPLKGSIPFKAFPIRRQAAAEAAARLVSDPDEEEDAEYNLRAWQKKAKSVAPPRKGGPIVESSNSSSSSVPQSSSVGLIRVPSEEFSDTEEDDEQDIEEGTMEPDLVDIVLTQGNDFLTRLINVQQECLPASREALQERPVHEQHGVVRQMLVWKPTGTRRDLNVWIPSNSSIAAVALRRELMTSAHNEQGHVPGAEATYQALRDQFRVYWDGMSTEVKAFTSACPDCQRAKATRALVPVAPLHPSTVPEQKWLRIIADLLGPFSADEGDPTYVLVVADALSSYVELFPITPEGKGPSAAEVRDHLHWIIETYGVPLKVQTDGASNMASSMTKEFIESLGAVKYETTPRRAQANGLVEVTNRLIQIALKCHIGTGDKNKFHAYLRQVKRDLNNRVHLTKGKSPFEIMFGFPQRTELMAKLDGLVLTGHPDSTGYIRALDAVHEAMDATVAIARAKTRQENIQRKRWHDDKLRVHRTFKINDYILLMNRTVPLKLESFYSNAIYQVKEILHGDTYRVEQIATKAETRAHASHMRWYDISESSVEEEIKRAFKESEGMIEKITRHSTEGSLVHWFSVQYMGHDKPTWLNAKELRNAPLFKSYCDVHHLAIPKLIAAVTAEEKREAAEAAI